MGMLGAVEGLGQGMAEVGSDWAKEAKDKRIMQMQEQMKISAEQRGEKRDIAAEQRKQTFQAGESEKSRKFQAEESARGHTRSMAKSKADREAELEMAKEKAKLGIGVSGEEGPSKRKRLQFEVYKDEREMYEGDAPFPTFENWLKQQGGKEAATSGAAPTEADVVRRGKAKDGTPVVQLKDGRVVPAASLGVKTTGSF